MKFFNFDSKILFKNFVHFDTYVVSVVYAEHFSQIFSTNHLSSFLVPHPQTLTEFFGFLHGDPSTAFFKDGKVGVLRFGELVRFLDGGSDVEVSHEQHVRLST